MLLDPASVHARAKALRLLLFDVDGVLTDGFGLGRIGRMEAKPFSIRDGAALVIAQREGLAVGLLSGRPSEATSRRAAELGITLVVQGGPDKRAGFSRILAEHGLDPVDVGYMGDDLLDLPILAKAGLSAAPADAVAEVRDRVHWISRHAGGRGAVREFVEVILRARERWASIVASAEG